MIELETQVVKINLGDSKQVTSYVFTMAEKVDSTDSELYVVCELPIFNPAARDECERIADAIAASLKRSYRKSVTDNTFENALAQINEELSKLVSLGKTHWLGKLNSAIAVKWKASLSVATVGKISVLLYRDGNFATIAESSTATHPLKTFENFSVGKLRLQDVFIIATTQVFNHISVDRIKSILTRQALPDAGQHIVNILQDNIGPEIACGAIFALQVEVTANTTDEEVNLQAYISPPPTIAITSATNKPTTLLDKAKNAVNTGMIVSKAAVSAAATKIKQPKVLVNNLFNKNRGAVGVVQDQFKKVSQTFQPATLKGLSWQKRFFLISAVVLLLALVTNIVITRYYQKNKTIATNIQSSIEAVQRATADANAAVLYGDTTKARTSLDEANRLLGELTNVSSEQQITVDDLRKQTVELANKIEKRVTVTPETITTLSNADRLIVLPSYFATEMNRTIVGYNRNSGSTQDGVIKSSEPVIASTFLKTTAALYNGSELFIWNPGSGILVGRFSDSVPSRDNAAGFRFYATNSRVYMIDKAKKQVVSFATTDKLINRPTISVTETAELASASDLAIDGNIYIAASGTILKFNSGKRQEFPVAVSGLSAMTKLYTEIGFNSLYVLDPGNKRIIILDKQGGLVKTMISDTFTDLKDFHVDEKNKIIVVLNNGSLLKINF